MIIRHSAIYLAATGAAGLINLAALLIYTRLLGPDGFGIFASAYAIIGLINSLLYWWLRLSVIRFMPSPDIPAEKLAGTIAGCFIGATLIALLIAIGAWMHFSGREGVTPALFVAAVAVLVAQGVFEVVLEFNRAKLEVIRYGFLLIVRAAVSLCAGAGIAVFWPSPVAVFVGLLAGYVAGLVLSNARSARRSTAFSFDRALAGAMIRFGAPLSIKFSSDIWILASGRLAVLGYFGAAAAGAYSAGLDLAQQFIGFIVSGIYLACFPLLVRAQEQAGVDATKPHFAHFRTLLAATILPVMIGVLFLDVQIVDLAFSDRYALLAGILPALAIAVLVLAMKSHYFDLTFQLAKDTRRQIAPSVVCALIATVAQLTLTPRFGLPGAAAATIAAALIGAGLSWWQGGRRFAVLSFGRDDAKVLLAVVMMAMLTWVGQIVLNVILAFIIATIAYVGALVIMNALEVQRHLRIAIHKMHSASRGG